PVVNITGGGSYCAGSTVILNAGGGFTDYDWSPGGQKTQTIKPDNTTTGTKTYSVTVIDANGCSATGTANVTINALPVVNITGAGIFCAGTDITLDAGGAPGDKYVWNTMETTETISPDNTTLGKTNYSVTITNSDGCSATGNADVTIKPVPKAKIMGGGSFCQGTDITLNAGGVVGNTYLWNTKETTKTIKPENTKPGTENYSVTVTATNGCSATDNTNVTINALPAVNITGGGSYCLGSGITLDAGGGVDDSYLWSPGGKTTQKINISSSTPGTLTYHVTITDVNGCSASNSTEVTINAPPTVDIIGGGDYCVGTDITLDAGGVTGDTYLWSPGNETTQKINPSSADAGKTTYSVTITNANGCSTTGSTDVIINPLPTVNIMGGGQYCQGSDITLDAGDGGDNYLWNPGGKTTQTIKPDNNAPGTKTYSVKVTDANGCSATGSTDVTINALPEVNIAGGGIFCAGTDITLDAGGVITDSYLWSPGSQTTQTIKAANTTMGSTIYSVKVIDGNGCAATGTATVTIKPLPTVKITGDGVFCAGTNITLNAGGVMGDTYQWSPGGETTQTIKPDNTKEGLTTYTVLINAANGCSASGSADVTINPLPTIDITGGGSHCQGTEVILDAGGENGDTYAWSTKESTKTIKPGNTILGTAKYLVTVTGVNGCTVSGSTEVTIEPLPTVDITGAGAFCAGTDITLVADGEAGDTYLWNTQETTQTINPDNTTTGNFNYAVTVTAPNGCTASADADVTIKPVPIVDLGDDKGICDGSSLTLDAGNEGDTYLWNTGENSQKITVKDAGTYSVKVNSTNGCSASDAINITLDPGPVVDLGGDKAICQGSALTLNAGNMGATYLWDDNSTDRTLTVNAAGTYTVKVTDGNGCSNTDQMTLSLNPLPSVNIGGDKTICAGSSLLLDAGNTGATYQWSTGETSQKITVKDAGTYSVKVTDANGCSGTDQMTLSLNPLPVIDFGGDKAICEGSTLTLDAGNAGSLYQWSTGETSKTITVKDAGSYSVIVTDANGCSSTGATNVKINPLPTVDLGPDQTVCQGIDVMLDAGNDGDNYVWNTGETSQSITATKTGTYSVTVTDANGCFAGDDVNVKVNLQPVIDLGPDQIVCQETKVTLDAGSGGLKYNWNTGEITQKINVTKSDNYTVTVTDANGCSGSDAVNIKFNALPGVDLGPDQTVCQGTDVILDAGDGQSSYIWSTGETTQKIHADKTNNYTVTVTDANGCSNTDVVGVTINPTPAIDLGPDRVICQGGSVVLNAENTGDAYLWSNNSTDQVISVTNNGKYWVKVTNAYGCSKADTMALLVNALPEVNLGNDTAICFGNSLTLDAGDNGNKYLWNDNSTSRTLTVNKAGTYSVKVTDGDGCSASDDMQLSINPLPVVNLGKDTSICIGSSIILDAGNGGNSYQWSNKETTQTISVNRTGTYSVTVTDGRQCSATGEISVTVKQLPVVDLGKDTSFCGGNQVTLDAGNPGATYQWVTGETTQKITAKDMGVYSVKVTDVNHCSATDSVKITVKPLPVVNSNRQASLCEGQSMKLDPANGNDQYVYQWQDGSTGPSITISKGGSYWVIISNGICLIRDTLDIKLLRNTLPRLSPELDICPGDSIMLDAFSEDAASYKWNTGATSPAISVKSEGEYILEIKGRYCNYVREDTSQVKTHPLPAVQLTADDISICNGEALHLRATGENTDYYRWGDSTTGNVHTIYKAGTYIVQAFNKCGFTPDSINVPNSGNCSAALYMPNAFSPNGDGMNDAFGPKDILPVSDFEMRIFNRWGQLLFVTHDYNAKWNGIFNGKPCDVGGYVWWVRYLDPLTNTVIFLKGALTLVR
ncbi:MAG TPA: gliding motility-associated C-terminal domain-containing protein, partial [Chitinophagaceae bacterium]|nr:gliding motility-associated C-terminal domain-containing protein [Chitinophagaceae bacterium]